MTTKQSGKMKLIFHHWILVFMTSSLLIACDGNVKFGDDGKDNSSEDEKKEIAIPVQSSIVSTGDITAFYPSTTTLEPEQEASVVAKVSGIVEKFYVEEGDTVITGQPLVQLETDRLRLELSRSKANLDKLKNDLKRTRAIYKKNLVSSESFEKLKFEYESKLAEYELARLELTFATVTAPIDGVISKRYVKVGNMITTNEPVFHITDFNPLHAIVYIPEKELNKIEKDQRVNVQVDARGGKHYQGFVKRISPVVDADSGTFKVTVEVTDPKNDLKPGMFGRLQIIQAVHTSAILIEKKAVLTEDISTSVFIIRDGRAFKQSIETGFINETKIEILSGLAVGDHIVTTGQNSLKNDSLVEILE